MSERSKRRVLVLAGSALALSQAISRTVANQGVVTITGDGIIDVPLEHRLAEVEDMPRPYGGTSNRYRPRDKPRTPNKRHRRL